MHKKLIAIFIALSLFISSPVYALNEARAANNIIRVGAVAMLLSEAEAIPPAVIATGVAITGGVWKIATDYLGGYARETGKQHAQHNDMKQYDQYQIDYKYDDTNHKNGK